MKLVILESPYKGDVERNERYGRAAMNDCLHRGESPYASHLLYTQPGVLRDEVPGERDLGIHAGFAWRSVASRTVVYVDLGISDGMRYGINHARSIGQEVEYRSIEAWRPQRDSLMMDGMLHTRGCENGCCDPSGHGVMGRRCTSCRGLVHQQPIYGGIAESCESCDPDDWRFELEDLVPEEPSVP